jgi:hypothetical protein
LRRIPLEGRGLVSKTTTLEAQLKAANDNHLQDAAAIEELRREIGDLKARGQRR